MADDFNQPAIGAPAPAVESVSLESLNAKLDQLLSLVAKPEVTAPVAIEAQKAEGAPEGTESAGSGEGDVKKLPEDIAEETDNEQPGKQAPESVKLEKAELEDIKKEVSEIKKSVEALNITKSTIGRPAATPKAKPQATEDLALDIAKGKKKMDWGMIQDTNLESDRKSVLEAIGRSSV